MGNARGVPASAIRLRGAMSMKSVCRFLTSKRILGAVSTLAITFAAPAVAEEEKTRNFSIEAQPLAMALVEFSRQSDITVIAPSKTTRGLQSRAVAGEMEPAEALEVLLGEADLELRTHRDRAIILAQVSEESAQVRDTQFEEDAGGFAVSADKGNALRQLEEIIVTGTNIRGVRNPTTPVIQFDREDIDLSGAATVDEFLRTVPQNFGLTTQATANAGIPTADNGNFQENVVDLRGVGAGATLTLLNGRRLAASGGRTLVDVSIFPIAVIDRVDVMTDGASAIYGSDAVAGVVNFITKTDFDGLEARGRYGTVTEGGGDQYQVGATAGKTWSSGGIFATVDYFEQSPLLIGDRDFIDLSLLPSEDVTITPDEERLSVAASFNKKIADRLSFATDLLFTARDTLINDFRFGSQNRFESDTYFVSSRINYGFSEELNAQLFFDYGEQGTDNSNSLDNFETTRTTENTLMTIEALLDGILLTMPGGDVSFAAGSQLRREEFSDNFGNSPGRDVVAVYGELLIPIIGDVNALPLVSAFDVSVAGRYENYDDIGDTFNPKVGLHWAINDNFSLRGTYSEAFRAPSLLSLFGPRGITVSALPSSFLTVAPPPAQDPNLPPGFTSFLTFSGGNPNLTEETATVYSVGFDYDPKWLDGLNLQAGYYDIGYTDRVEFIDFLSVLQNSEFVSLLDTSPDIAFVESQLALINDPSVNFEIFPPLDGSVTADDIQNVAFTGVRNVQSRDIRGIDFLARYEITSGIGDIGFSINATHTLDYKMQLADGSSVTEQVDRVFRPVDLRLRGDLSWSRDGLTAFAAFNYVDDYEANSGEQIDAWTTLDLTLAYSTDRSVDNSLFDNTRMSLSVQNVFSEDPPFVATANGLNYDPTNANALGRFISVNLSKSF